MWPSQVLTLLGLPPRGQEVCTPHLPPCARSGITGAPPLFPLADELFPLSRRLLQNRAKFTAPSGASMGFEGHQQAVPLEVNQPR